MTKGTASALINEAEKMLGTIGGQKIRNWYNKNIDDIGNNLWFWCCAFIVYCAVRAGIPTNVILYTASTSVMREFFIKQNRYKSKESGYKPKAGDLLLFDYNLKDQRPTSHIGIVTSCDGSYVHTIEGNSGNKSDGEVMRHKYPLNYQYIRGYGLPNYKKEKDENTLDKTGFKKGDNKLGVLALKELLLVAKNKKLITAKFDENKTFGAGTEKAVNELLKKWNYKESGIAGEKFIKKLKDALIK